MSDDQHKTEKPCLIKTEQGFSVFYKNRYLYSRYAPRAAVSRLVQSAVVLPQSLIFCFSPVLGYGLNELLAATDENSFIIGLETDKVLYDFSLEYLDARLLNNPRFLYVHLTSAQDFALFMTESPARPDFGQSKRCVFFDFSGGVQLYESLYGTIKLFADDFIGNYWKNRITLVKLGRLFSRNLFRNLGRIPYSAFLRPKSLAKPILIFGAGPSFDEVAPLIREQADNFFILAVDSALVPLLKHGIKPNAVIALESQLANVKAFIGAADCDVLLIADVTSRPSITRLSNNTTAFVCSHYTDADFFSEIEKLLMPLPLLPSLGSVGLAALEIALFLRQDSSVPVFFAGLDFSFIPGKTHCREAPPLRYALNVHYRLAGLENPAPAYRDGCIVFTGKDGGAVVSNPALAGYGTLLGARYARVPLVFDISSAGMNTGCACLEVSTALTLAADIAENSSEKTGVSKKNKNLPSLNYSLIGRAREVLEKNIASFYRNEIATLEKIKALLSGGGSTDEICTLLAGREYLFLHFPDGHLGIQKNTAFLKRVRSEIDFFLKDLRIGAQALKELP